MPGRTGGFSSGGRSFGGSYRSSSSGGYSYRSSSRGSSYGGYTHNSSPKIAPTTSYIPIRRTNDDDSDKKKRSVSHNKVEPKENIKDKSVAPIQQPTYSPPSFFQTIKEGFGFGMGSSIAHNIFDSKKEVVVSHTNIPSTSTNKPTNEICDKIIKEYNDCQINYCNSEKLDSIQKLYEQCKELR